MDFIDSGMVEENVIKRSVKLIYSMHHISSLQFHKYGFPQFFGTFGNILLCKNQIIAFIPFGDYIPVDFVRHGLSTFAKTQAIRSFRFFDREIFTIH